MIRISKSALIGGVVAISIGSMLGLMSVLHVIYTDRVSEQVNETPIKIGGIEGVKVWKLRDHTRGGASYVYFTSRGDTYEEHTEGKTTVRVFTPAAGGQ